MARLNEHYRKVRRKAIATGAARMAGSSLDLDKALEAGASEHLLEVSKMPSRKALAYVDKPQSRQRQ
jgi:hypothetical protein